MTEDLSEIAIVHMINACMALDRQLACKLFAHELAHEQVRKEFAREPTKSEIAVEFAKRKGYTVVDVPLADPEEEDTRGFPDAHDLRKEVQEKGLIGAVCGETVGYRMTHKWAHLDVPSIDSPEYHDMFMRLLDIMLRVDDERQRQDREPETVAEIWAHAALCLMQAKPDRKPRKVFDLKVDGATIELVECVSGNTVLVLPYSRESENLMTYLLAAMPRLTVEAIPNLPVGQHFLVHALDYDACVWRKASGGEVLLVSWGGRVVETERVNSATFGPDVSTWIVRLLTEDEAETYRMAARHLSTGEPPHGHKWRSFIKRRITNGSSG